MKHRQQSSMKTITFQYKKTGPFAQEAHGEFKYSTKEGARKAYLKMKRTSGFYNVKLKK